MSLVSFVNLKSIFGRKPSTDEERQRLLKETLLLTLARASDSDTNVQPVEVDTVIEIMERALGVSVSAAEVRIAAASELYETASLEDYLRAAGRNLNEDERMTILEGLAEVIKSDLRVSPYEVDFFNHVTKALHVTSAEVAGLLDKHL